MKIFSVVFVLLCFTLISFSQTKNGPKFDIEDFNKKFEVVEWLVKYDFVAWKTSDVVLAQKKEELEKLGGEWFCFEDVKGLWHAVYGKYQNDNFELVFHFTMDGDAAIVRVEDKIDSEFLNSHSRALITARSQMNGALKEIDAPLFNQYIKQNADKSFTVWLLPAFQRSGVAVYGGEFIYDIDKTGKLTKTVSSVNDGFRGFKADNPREIWLNYRNYDKPGLGAIFFVWYYKQYFTKIFIDNAKSTSTVVNDGKESYIWVHFEKEPLPKPTN